jgi:hypothetical protein
VTRNDPICDIRKLAHCRTRPIQNLGTIGSSKRAAARQFDKHNRKSAFCDLPREGSVGDRIYQPARKEHHAGIECEASGG